MDKKHKKPDPTRAQSIAQAQAKKEKLAKALRDNLKRRKAPAPVSSKEACDE
jgi:tRNA A37 threonylcarbamoyladenosine dehydratase